MSAWSIDFKVNHCGHPVGLQAYWDPIPTSSGAIRCIGPFSTGNRRVSVEVVRELIFDLSCRLESYYSCLSAYVVWGAKHAVPDFEDHKFLILGEDEVGFIPNPVLRSELVEEFGSSDDFVNEWDLNVQAGYVDHRMGIRFVLKNARKNSIWSGNSRSVWIEPMVDAPDSAVIHPRLAETMLPLLADRAYRLYCDALHERPGKRVARLRQPLFRWTEAATVP